MTALHIDPVNYLLLAFLVAFGLALCWFFVAMHIKAQHHAGQDRRQEPAPHELDWLNDKQKAQLDVLDVRALAARSACIDIASDAAFSKPNPFPPGTLNHTVWFNQYCRTLGGMHSEEGTP
jgi:hypothetical protein